MLPRNLTKAAQALSREPARDVWIVALAPRLDADSGAVVLQAVAPRSAWPKGDAEQYAPLDPDPVRWRYVVRWARRWATPTPEAIGVEIAERFGEFEQDPQRPVWSSEPVGERLRGTLLIDTTKSGRLLAQAIQQACGRAAEFILASQLGPGQLVPEEADVHRMPTLEAQGAVQAVASRIILADGSWANDLRARISNPTEIETGAEWALAVAIWWTATYCTGDAARKRELATFEGDMKRGEEEASVDMRWMLGVGR